MELCLLQLKEYPSLSQAPDTASSANAPDNYEEGEKVFPPLGRGSFGVVHRIALPDGSSLVRKEGTLGRYECTALQSRSDYVPRLRSYTQYTITMELLATKVHFCASTAIPIIQEICFGLIDVTQKCQEQGLIPSGKSLVHRDLKPLNLAVDAEGHLKLIDWGIAELAGEVMLSPESDTLMPPGTPGYLPPESYQSGSTVTVKIDSWSMGIMLYGFLTNGERPIPGRSGFLLSSDIAEIQLPQTSSEPVNNSTRIFLDSLQTVSQTVAPIFSILLSGLLEIDPDKRFSPQEALSIIVCGSPNRVLRPKIPLLQENHNPSQPPPKKAASLLSFDSQTTDASDSANGVSDKTTDESI